MRKIGIVGGTGIENPDTLKGFETKISHACYGNKNRSDACGYCVMYDCLSAWQ